MGGAEKGAGRGRGTQTKSLVAVAVEHAGRRKPDAKPVPGRMALSLLPDARAESLREFLRRHVKPKSAVFTDGFSSYGGLTPRGYAHVAVPLRHEAQMAERFFPWVHITLSNLKRFLLGTHPKPQAKHLRGYLAEFTYRLNRRWQEAHLFEHLAQACLATNTITYKDLVASPELA